MTSSTPGRLSKTGASTAPRLPVIPMAVRWAPGMGWALNPRASMAATTPRISSGVALCRITTSTVAFSLEPLILCRDEGRVRPYATISASRLEGRERSHPPGQSTLRQEIHRQAHLGFRAPRAPPEEDAGPARPHLPGRRRRDRLGHLHRGGHRHRGAEVRVLLGAARAAPGVPHLPVPDLWTARGRSRDRPVLRAGGRGLRFRGPLLR